MRTWKSIGLGNHRRAGLSIVAVNRQRHHVTTSRRRPARQTPRRPRSSSMHPAQRPGPATRLAAQFAHAPQPHVDQAQPAATPAAPAPADVPASPSSVQQLVPSPHRNALLVLFFQKNYKKFFFFEKKTQKTFDCWRKEWDSNPRYAFTHTRFPSVRLKPLGHPSCAAPEPSGAKRRWQARNAAPTHWSNAGSTVVA